MLVSHALRSAGYQCQLAADAVQALALTKQSRPALVVTDYMMPAGGGSSLHKRLRLSVQTSDVPILILSAADEVEILKSVDMDPHTYFLAKPYRKDLLLATVAQILQETGQA